MTFSIIIINYKTPDLSADCLHSLLTLGSAPDLEIIVIDNASYDNSASLLKDEFGDKIQLIENEKNLGFSGANNLAAKNAKGEVLLFLNSDTILKEDIFPRLKNLFIRDEKLGAISPTLITLSGKEQEATYGKFPTLKKLVLRQIVKKDKEESNALIEADWISGCAMAVKKNVFDKIQGFDENFFLYYEDVDICKRIKEVGYKVAIDTKSSLVHLGGASLGLNRKRKEYYYASQDYYFKKHHGNVQAAMLKVIRLPWRLLKIR